MCHGLHRVGVDDGAVARGKLGKRLEVLDDSSLVIHEGRAHESGRVSPPGGREELLGRGEIETAVGIHRREIPVERTHRIHNRGVIRRKPNDTPSDPAKGKIVGFRATGGHDDPAARNAKDIRDLRNGIIENPAHAAPRGVLARRVTEGAGGPRVRVERAWTECRCRSVI